MHELEPPSSFKDYQQLKSNDRPRRCTSRRIDFFDDTCGEGGALQKIGPVADLVYKVNGPVML